MKLPNYKTMLIATIISLFAMIIGMFIGFWFLECTMFSHWWFAYWQFNSSVETKILIAVIQGSSMVPMVLSIIFGILTIYIRSKRTQRYRKHPKVLKPVTE